MTGLYYKSLVFFALISLIGGINWLFTAINNWTDDEVTNDLLTKQLNINPHVANGVYVVVFLCTLALFLMVVLPEYKLM